MTTHTTQLQQAARDNAQQLRTGESAFARAAATAEVVEPTTALAPAVGMFDADAFAEEPTVGTGERTKRTVRIYATGGTGVNLARRLEGRLKRIDTAAVADFDIVNIDTSSANYVNGVAPENSYMIGNGKGSGKDRTVNVAAAKAAAPDILEKFPATPFTIFLTGLSGGSGSAITPALLGRAIRAGINCVVVGVVSSASVKEIYNTLKTTESFEQISANTGVPVITTAFHNERLGGEERANQACLSTVLMLGTLLSGLNDRLDDTDVRNFLDYRSVSKAPAKLMGLVTDGPAGSVVSSNNLIPVTVATLAKDPASQAAPAVYDYQAAGFYPDCAPATPTVHFMVVDNYIQTLYANLAADQRKLEAAAPTRSYTGRIGGVQAGSEDDDDVVV